MDSLKPKINNFFISSEELAKLINISHFKLFNIIRNYELKWIKETGSSFIIRARESKIKTYTCHYLLYADQSLYIANLINDYAVEIVSFLWFYLEESINNTPFYLLPDYINDNLEGVATIKKQSYEVSIFEPERNVFMDNFKNNLIEDSIINIFNKIDITDSKNTEPEEDEI